MSVADNAQVAALPIDGQAVPSAATRTLHDPATGEPLAEYTTVKHVVFELTGASRKECCDAVSTPEVP